MTLSDREIKKFIARKKISFFPEIPISQIGSCSVDLRLGNRFRVFEHSRIPFFDTKSSDGENDFMKEITVSENESFVLQPQDFVLAQTIENIRLSDELLARLEGRSSLGRLGIVVHSTASVFEPGFCGTAVLELGNLGRMPVALYPGMKICALTFETLSSPAEIPYGKKSGAKYQNQQTPIPSKIKQDK